MIKLLRAAQITGWRRNAKLFGKPDFVFPKQRVVVFVDGCFWHRHPRCQFAYTPKSQLGFWLPKFKRNISRDKVVTRTLSEAGWRIVRVWECNLSAKREKSALRQVKRLLKGNA